jgi:phage regulator Rha-like protein
MQLTHKHLDELRQDLASFSSIEYTYENGEWGIDSDSLAEFLGQRSRDFNKLIEDNLDLLGKLGIPRNISRYSTKGVLSTTYRLNVNHSRLLLTLSKNTDHIRHLKLELIQYLAKLEELVTKLLERVHAQEVWAARDAAYDQALTEFKVNYNHYGDSEPDDNEDWYAEDDEPYNPWLPDGSGRMKGIDYTNYSPLPDPIDW